MVAKVKVLPYQCEVCQKTYSTEKQAEKCENSHEVTRVKEEKEIANRMKLYDRLVEIRNTSESWEELQEKALAELKVWYGDDFILLLPHSCNDRWAAKCTYRPEKSPKKTDYFNRWGDKEIDASRILKTLGFKTSGGSGDGKVFFYGVSYDINDFPAIQAKKLERERAVEDAVQAMRRLSNDTYIVMYNDQTYNQHMSDVLAIRDQIEELEEQYGHAISKKEEYIKKTYVSKYEAECNGIIMTLPQQFKREHADPRPLDYFME